MKKEDKILSLAYNFQLRPFIDGLLNVSIRARPYISFLVSSPFLHLHIQTIFPYSYLKLFYSTFMVQLIMDFTFQPKSVPKLTLPSLTLHLMGNLWEPEEQILDLLPPSTKPLCSRGTKQKQSFH